MIVGHGTQIIGAVVAPCWLAVPHDTGLMSEATQLREKRPVPQVGIFEESLKVVDTALPDCGVEGIAEVARLVAPSGFVV